MCANTRVEVSHHLVERVLQFCLLRVFRADEEENSFYLLQSVKTQFPAATDGVSNFILF